MLLKLVQETENMTPSINNNAIAKRDNRAAVAIPAGQNVTNNTQVINQNIPRLPAMYFPHSNVTINYNFNK